jgi:hypothetical protein
LIEELEPWVVEGEPGGVNGFCEVDSSDPGEAMDPVTLRGDVTDTSPLVTFLSCPDPISVPGVGCVEVAMGMLDVNGAAGGIVGDGSVSGAVDGLRFDSFRLKVPGLFGDRMRSPD